MMASNTRNKKTTTVSVEIETADSMEMDSEAAVDIITTPTRAEDVVKRRKRRIMIVIYKWR